MNLDYILGLHCVTKKKSFTNKPVEGIFGVKINTTNSNPETALTYTDDAIGFTPAKMNFDTDTFNYGSWENIYPFNQIKPCLLKNGVVQYYLNPNDYSKKLDGSPADITSGNDGYVMVEFPKIYWKFERIGTDLYIRYSDVQVDKGYKCLAHMRGEDIKSKIYISAYISNESSGIGRSLSGLRATRNRTIDQSRRYSKKNGAGYDQIAYYQLLMLQVLYLVMFKNRDSQASLGRGHTSGAGSLLYSGGTNTKGLFYGESTGKQHMKFCGIEDFWGNCTYWIDGIYSNVTRNILIGTKDFNDTGVGYTDYGKASTANISGYYISDIQGGTETGFIPKETSGDIGLYYADSGALKNWSVPDFGGGTNSANVAGVFRMYLTHEAPVSNTSVGYRLMYV